MKIAILARAQRIPLLATAAAALLLILSLGVSAAELYRWTDARGVVHYTDKPPRGVNAERIGGDKPRSLSNPAADPEVAADETPDPDAERCKAERERLAVLQSNRRIQMENRDGSVKELSDAEVQQEMEFSRRAIERFCKPQPTAEE